MPVRGSTTPGTPTTTPSMSASGEPGGFDEGVAEPGSRGQPSTTSSAGSRSSTSCRARTSPREVAERAAEEASPEVEPEHERGLRRRLEEDRAVARPLGRRSASRTRPASRSDWSATETVGFEIPARREISAREIGAPRPDRLEDGALVQPPEERRNGAIAISCK